MNKVDGYGSLNFPQEDVGPIEQTVPIEIIKKILFFLGDRTLQSAGIVCRRWSQATVAAAAEKKDYSLKIFTKFLTSNLNKNLYGNQIEKLNHMDRDTTLFASDNLIQVKSSFLMLREKYINILKDVEKADLQRSDQIAQRLPVDESVTVSYMEIFYLATLYRKIDQANAEPVEIIKNALLASCSASLVVFRQIDKAIEVVKTIPDGSRGKSSSLKLICNGLILRGQFNKAIEVANMVPEKQEKEAILKKIAEAMENKCTSLKSPGST